MRDSGTLLAGEESIGVERSPKGEHSMDGMEQDLDAIQRVAQAKGIRPRMASQIMAEVREANNSAEQALEIADVSSKTRAKIFPKIATAQQQLAPYHLDPATLVDLGPAFLRS